MTDAELQVNESWQDVTEMTLVGKTAELGLLGSLILIIPLASCSDCKAEEWT